MLQLNPAPGTPAVLGALLPPMEALERSYNGNLYGISAGSSPSLYLIDRTNAATTLVGTLGISTPGLDFAGLAIKVTSLGGVYAAVSSATTSRLYTLAANGMATLRGEVGFPRVAGLAFHVRRPGQLSIQMMGTNVTVRWPSTNGGYLWQRENVTSFGSPVFNTTFLTTNRLQMFYLSSHPPF